MKSPTRSLLSLIALGTVQSVLAGAVMAQAVPVQPVFPSINPGSMVWEQGKASGAGRICGKTYSDDNEKAVLLDREARGLCGAYKRVNPAFLRFTPDLALRKSVASQFASALSGGDPASSASRFVASGAALSDAHRRMTALGLAPNNLGDAMAFFLASHWSFTQGSAAPPARPTMLALKTQMAAMLGSQPNLAQMPNAAKQQQADSMLILTAVSMQEMQKVQGDPAGNEAVAASASQMLKGMGFDPAAFELTAQGMVAAR